MCRGSARRRGRARKAAAREGRGGVAIAWQHPSPSPQAALAPTLGPTHREGQSQESRRCPGGRGGEGRCPGNCDHGEWPEGAGDRNAPIRHHRKRAWRSAALRSAHRGNSLATAVRYDTAEFLCGGVCGNRLSTRRGTWRLHVKTPAFGKVVGKCGSTQTYRPGALEQLSNCAVVPPLFLQLYTASTACTAVGRLLLTLSRYRGRW